MNKTKKVISRYGIALYAGAALFCMCLNLTGSVLSEIMTDYNMNLDHGGLMSFAQYMGGVAAILVLSAVSDRLRKPVILVFGFAVTAAMLALIGGFQPFALFMVLYLILGAGLGVIDATNNAVVSDLFQENRNTMLCILHGVCGIGAIIIPIATALAGNGNWRTVYGIVAVVILVLAVFQSVLYGTGKKVIDRRVIVAPQEGKNASASAFFRDRKVWLAVLVQVLYGASQTGITVWGVKYCKDAFPEAGALVWALPISLYWLGTMIFRLMLGLVPALQKWKSQSIVIGGGLLSGAVLLPGVLSGNLSAFLICIFAQGFFSGGTLPRVVGLLTGWYPEKSGLATSISFVASYIGFGCAPLLMGVIAASLGMVQMFFVSIAAALLSGIIGFLLPKEK